MNLDTAREVANEIVAVLAPACERIEIAGSIRRLKPEPKDVRSTSPMTDEEFDAIYAHAEAQRQAEIAAEIEAAWQQHNTGTAKHDGDTPGDGQIRRARRTPSRRGWR